MRGQVLAILQDIYISQFVLEKMSLKTQIKTWHKWIHTLKLIWIKKRYMLMWCRGPRLKWLKSVFIVMWNSLSFSLSVKLLQPPSQSFKFISRCHFLVAILIVFFRLEEVKLYLPHGGVSNTSSGDPIGHPRGSMQLMSQFSWFQR